MKSTPAFICGTLLTAMVGAGLSHYWSVETFVANYPTSPAVRLAPERTADKKILDLPIRQPLAVGNTSTEPELATQKEFFNSLLAELKNLKNENRDLRDLMGETNRDVMKLAFKVDTHSESFRPLPTTEERSDTTFDFQGSEFPGVLPPRANPVYNIEE